MLISGHCRREISSGEKWTSSRADGASHSSRQSKSLMLVRRKVILAHPGMEVINCKSVAGGRCRDEQVLVTKTAWCLLGRHFFDCSASCHVIGIGDWVVLHDKRSLRNVLSSSQLFSKSVSKLPSYWAWVVARLETNWVAPIESGRVQRTCTNTRNWPTLLTFFPVNSLHGQISIS